MDELLEAQESLATNMYVTSLLAKDADKTFLPNVREMLIILTVLSIGSTKAERSRFSDNREIIKPCRYCNAWPSYSSRHQENLWAACSTSPKKNDAGLSLRIACIKVPTKYMFSSAHKSKEEIYLISTFAIGYFYLSAFYFIFPRTDTVYLSL